MRFRPFPTIAVASIVCCSGLCGLWWRSCRHYDFVAYGQGKRAIGVMIEGGGVEAWWTRDAATAYNGWYVESFPVAKARTGYGFGVTVTADTWTTWYPLWLPVLIAAMPPALWWRRHCKQHSSGFTVEIAADSSLHSE